MDIFRPFCAALAFLQTTAVAQWMNGQPADIVLGQESFVSSFNSVTPAASSLYSPQGIAVDAATGKVFVADATNNRVLRWSSIAALQNGATAEVVLGQPEFTSRMSGTSQNGMSFPQSIALDDSGRLWLADRLNNRVLRFDHAAAASSGANADGVLGQPDFSSHASSTTQNGMSFPAGVAVDLSGRLWVADETNHRVVRFDNAAAKPNGANADQVLGQPDFGTRRPNLSRNGMFSPTGVVEDNDGRLWVADRTNNRVLRFDNAASKPSGSDADGVLGQPHFASAMAAATPNAMSGPIAVAADSLGNLYVVDASNNRILRFDRAAGKPNGGNADGVLGQPGFGASIAITEQESGGITSASLTTKPRGGVDLPGHGTLDNDEAVQLIDATILAAPTASGLLSPSYLALDNQNNLWVADNGNRRVLRFEIVSAKPNGAEADGVLGQPDFVTLTPIISAGTLSAPTGVAFDPQTGKLFVADQGNHRILRWHAASAGVTGSQAEAVFGQADFTSNQPNRGGPPAANTLNSPYALAIDNVGRLWVVDRRNARILRFDQAATKPSGADADGVLGQADFAIVSTIGDSTPTQGSLSRLVLGVAVDHSGHLYVADGNSVFIARVLRWDDAAAKPNGAPADGVLGQADFTSALPYRGGTKPAANNMRAGFGVAVDQEGTLYVADVVRVLRFDDAAAKSNGAEADGVLGQPDFTADFGSLGSGGNTLTPDRVNGPISVAVDGAGNLYVGDLLNRRTLVFLNAKTKPNGAPADFVLGQPNFFSDRNEVSQGIAAAANQTAIDNANGKIWLAFGGYFANGHNRVLRFSASRPLAIAGKGTELPKHFALAQNYPNPFNPKTRFSYSLPSAHRVSLRIHDVFGREVTTLVNAHKDAGIYEVTFDASGISSGLYFYRMEAGTFSATRKMIVAK